MGFIGSVVLLIVFVWVIWDSRQKRVNSADRNQGNSIQIEVTISEDENSNLPTITLVARSENMNLNIEPIQNNVGAYNVHTEKVDDGIIRVKLEKRHDAATLTTKTLEAADNL